MSAAAQPRQSRVCPFVFQSDNHAGTRLKVVLEYHPAQAFKKEAEAKRTKVIERGRRDPMIDREYLEQQYEASVRLMLAGRIKRVDAVGEGANGVLVSQVADLMWLEAEDIVRYGGMGAWLPFDPSDATPLTPEDRAKFKLGEKAKTVGDAGLWWVLQLLENSAEFNDWVSRVAFDISCFREPLEDELKNLQTGAAGTPAPSVNSSTPSPE
jgi:hypothetical protein